MNCKQANDTIKVPDILDRLGYTVQQKHKGGSEWAYLAPWRKEAQGSLFVNIRSQAFFDHGLGEGGRGPVDFAILYLNQHGQSNGVSDALSWLEELGLGDQPLRSKDFFVSERTAFLPQDEDIRDLEFIRAKPVAHPAIFQYLQGRGIRKDLISKYLDEVQYRNKKIDKVFFAFGMKNRAEGYEIRAASDNPGFKSALIKKDISFIEGQNKNSKSFLWFEGITDYLSYLTMNDQSALHDHVIVLHSLTNHKKALEFISNQEVARINLWLDNDASGKKLVKKLKMQLGECVVDHSPRYPTFKDLNQALQAFKEQILGLQGYKNHNPFKKVSPDFEMALSNN